MARAEGGGGYGFDPEEYARFGDSSHEEWNGVVSWVTNEPDQLEDHELVRSSDVAKYEHGDQVKATSDVKGALFTRVPAGTRGQVVSTREGLFTSYVTVRFDNGYTEEIKESTVKKIGFWG